MYLLVFRVCEVWKAINIVLKGGQGTLRSDVWYSKISVLSFIKVFFNFLKNLRSVLFPGIVMSALIGLVLYMSQDFSCLMTGSRFRCFCSNYSVFFPVAGRKLFSTFIFVRGTVSSGSWRSKI